MSGLGRTAGHGRDRYRHPLSSAAHMLAWTALFLATSCSVQPDIEFLTGTEEHCSLTWGDFVEGHRGTATTFDATVAEVLPYDEKEDRFDYVVRPGDVAGDMAGDTAKDTAKGAWILFTDVTLDELARDGIDTALAVDTRARFTAVIESYDAENCILNLDLQKTVLR